MKDTIKDWIRRIQLLFYFGVLLLVFIIFILEIKRAYSIDFIPNFNGEVDDEYFRIKDGWFN
jgi:hypothetical protein